LNASDADVEAIAERFVLNPGQIEDAVTWLGHAQHLDGNATGREPPAELLFDAARTVSSGPLGKLAVKVNNRFGWDDLVLPPVLLQQIQEVAAAIKHRKLVYGEWGMARRFGDGGGLKVLFSGASGTGKTMTASVLARDLGLDLFRIDLSGVVSKYIGETEKNLDQIFTAAQSSNAILFFDEADALFGKRSEVKDAHDRYANIEVSYLLQKMEEYDGVVILASNLSKNIDQAFARRMHYAIEFPRPGKEHRQQLWRGMFRPETPLGDDVDFAFLAHQFELTGGDIKNVVLAAAFLAVDDGQVIHMEQIVKALARQMMRQGKMPGAVEFKQYHAFLGPNATIRTADL
jgi:SpoVK/Ycf46/Vps4 family AAA+-type ATPase